MSASVFTPSGKADSKAAGWMGARAERAAVCASIFESIARSQPERWIPPPLSVLYGSAAAQRIPPERGCCFIDVLNAVRVVQCGPAFCRARLLGSWPVRRAICSSAVSAL
jgi:hypothetical protein